MSDLPAFPVDDETLDLIETAIRNPGGERSNLFGVLDFLANGTLMPIIEPSGRDDDGNPVIEIEDLEERWSYGPNDVVLALITEVRRLRKAPLC